jgi:hypothetical protein
MTPKNDAPQLTKKRPYRVPTLTVHGDLKDLAKVTTKGGTAQDGGKPASRMTGTPA